MLWYVALIAILNLGLGYGLAIYLGAGRRRHSPTAIDSELTLQRDEIATEQYAERSEPAFAIESDCVAPAPAPALADLPTAAEIDPTTGLTTRNHIAQRLTDMTLAHADLQPMTVALVEVDQAAASREEDLEDRLLRGVADTLRGMLTDAHTAGRYSEQQFLLLLPFDDLQHATERTEQVRQCISATHFVADGKEIPTTVTCALAQVAASQSAEDLLENLIETLEEAKRFGGNRTFMHDGKAPTPVVPPELNFAAETCAI